MSLQDEYLAAYPEWIASLTPEERAKVKHLGLDQPDTDCPQINGKRRSVEDMTFLREKAKGGDPRSMLADLLGRALLEIVSARTPMLHLDAFISALGLYDYEGVSCEQLGKRHGVSKQRFSLVRSTIIDRYALPEPPKGKTRKQRASQRKKKWTSK